MGCRRKTGKEEGILDSNSGTGTRIQMRGAWLGKSKWKSLLLGEQQEETKRADLMMDSGAL